MSEPEDTLHEHEPESMVVAFYRTCKHCGVIVEPEYCATCDGHAGNYAMKSWQRCAACKGTGIKRWVEEKR